MPHIEKLPAKCKVDQANGEPVHSQVIRIIDEDDPIVTTTRRPDPKTGKMVLVTTTDPIRRSITVSCVDEDAFEIRATRAVEVLTDYYEAGYDQGFVADAAFKKEVKEWEAAHGGETIEL